MSGSVFKYYISNQESAINMSCPDIRSASEPEEVKMEVTALHLAVIGRHKHIVKYLLNAATRFRHQIKQLMPLTLAIYS